MVKAAFFNEDPGRIEQVYGAGRRDLVAARTDLYPEVISAAALSEHAPHLRELEVIFSTWGMPSLGAAELELLPELKAVFYAAGSVKGFAVPLLERGIVLMSAWGANAVPVAEFAVAQILLACKGYFRNTRECRDADQRRGGPFRGRGVFGETVGLVGVGMIGSRVCELLQRHELHVVGHDINLTEARACALGVEPVALSELFQRAYVVSNHLPNVPATRGLLDRQLFASMRQDATFINTGRGAQVVEEDLIAVLQQRPDLTALLDVTYPEPPAPDSPLYTLPNVQLSSHIAGSLNDEVVRMADYALAEFARWERGQPLHYQVTLDMLETMA